MQTLYQFENVKDIYLEAGKKEVIRENLIRFMQNNPWKQKERFINTSLIRKKGRITILKR